MEKENLNNLTSWLERGKKLIYPEKYSQWVNAVLNGGTEILYALEIMEDLAKNKEMEEVIEKFQSFPLVKTKRIEVIDIIFEFSNRGPEFYEIILPKPLNIHLKKMILEKKQENIQLYLLSLTKKFETQKLEFNNNIPQWLEKGKNLIPEELYPLWEDYLNNPALQLYYGTEIDITLDIIEDLNNNVDYKTISKKLYESNLSYIKIILVRELIKQFSLKGNDFLLAVDSLWEKMNCSTSYRRNRKKI